MMLELTLHFTPERVQLNLPQTGHTQDELNLVALNPTTRRILGFGASREQVRQKLGERWEETKEDLVFKSALGLEEPDLDLDKYTLWRWVSRAHQHLRGASGLKKLIYQVLDRFDIDLRIDGYERFTPERRQALESFLQSDLRARKLVINGSRVDSPPALRSLEAWVRILFTLTVPYLFIGAAVFIALGLPESSLPGGSKWVALGLILLLGGGVELLGIAAWMVVMRRFLPTGYLRYFLPRLPMQSLTRRLANFLLREENERKT